MEGSPWAGDCGLDPGDQPNYPNEPGHLVLARLLLAQGDAAAAGALLDRLDAAAAGQQRIGSVIEIRAIRAMALAALGDEAGAAAALTSALELGWPQGYIRVFADEGPAMAAVLGMLIAAQRSDQRAARIPLACLARLQRAFGDGHPAGGGAGPDSRSSRLIEQLTSRELEVLAMLAAGRSNLTGRGELARVGPDGQVSRIRLETGQSRPVVLARGPDDAIWFSRGDGRIGRTDPAGSMPSLITAGPDTALWPRRVGLGRPGSRLPRASHPLTRRC